MGSNALFVSMHELVGWLRVPVIGGLMLLVCLAIWQVGVAVGERFRGLGTLRLQGNAGKIEALARRRVEQADLMARIGPMLGLMGTLIPLGPGLAALGRGDLETLAASVITAFDTTVMGLLIGVVGFALGRLRRRWYETLLEEVEA